MRLFYLCHLLIAGQLCDYHDKLNIMRTISVEEIEKYLTEIDNTPEKDVEAMVMKMSEEQPVVMPYLMAVGGEDFDENESEGFFYLGFSLWYIMRKINTSLHIVSEEELEAEENNNFKMLEVMSDETEAGITQLIEMIIENYNQPNLFGFIVESLMEEEDEDGDLLFDPDNSGMMLIYLKTVIDCFDKY
jgi:riboflavin synthase